VGGDYGGVAQGIEVTLQLDEERFSDHTAYLFASVVERFLGAWVSINSFSRMVATSRQQESRREQWRWPPRAGNRTLV
jgi:type VI secretion system protein ImpG